MHYMNCVKLPILTYYIACLICNRQENKEFNFIYDRKGKCAVSSLLKIVTAWWMYETCRRAVYDILMFHITYKILRVFYAVRLEICRSGSIFYSEIEPVARWHCCSPPSEIFETE
jgi:hypothetical protein